MLAAWVQPAMGQTNNEGQHPEYPTFPYPVTLAEGIEHGKVTFKVADQDAIVAYPGEEITVMAELESGYVVKEITVTNEKDGESIVKSEKPLVKQLTFIMPASPVTITATFVPDKIQLNDKVPRKITSPFGKKATFNVADLVSNKDNLVDLKYAIKEAELLPFSVSIDENGELSCVPTSPGTYNINVELSAEPAQPISTKITIEVTKSTLASNIEAEESSISGGGGWNRKTTLTAPNGYQIALVKDGVNPLDFDWGKSIEITKSGDYNQQYMLRSDDGTIYVGDKKTVHIYLDCSAPSIKMEGDHSNVYITITDEQSGISEISYRLDNGDKEKVSVSPGQKNKSFYVEASYGVNHTVWVSVEDRAGNSNSKTESFYLIEPTYHTVTLPEIPIGATTDPAAGEHSVEEGYDFVFSILLEDDYNQSVPVVTIGMGEPLTPRKSDGKYVISFVRKDLSVSISGIVKNPDPVSNAVITSGTKLKVQEHMLCLQVDHPATLYVVTLAGRLWHTQSLSVGETFVEGLPSGVYIVSLSSGERWKVMVR